MSFKPEVIVDNSGEWCGNRLVFATKQESDSYADDLRWRWTLVREFRSVETGDPVTHRWVPGVGLQSVVYHPEAAGFRR